MLLVDAHEDLAWNVLTFERDYTLAAAETRRREQGSEATLHNGDTLLGWPDYQRGEVASIFATLFAAPARRRLGEWDTQFYTNPESAYRVYSRQLDVYHRLVDDHADKFRLIFSLQDFLNVIDPWERAPDKEHPVGLVVLMEGAEGVRAPGELEEWRERGVRLIGPAWAGTRYCGGTNEPGPLTPEGYALLEGMADLGFSLDLSHMDEQAALQALDYYSGSIIASHANAAALLKGEVSNRFLSDRLIRGLIERDGVIGIVPYIHFLDREWTSKDGRQAVTLGHVMAQIDYICQIAGDARHVGIGTDFDGGFGLQYAPAGVDTIADLQKLVPLLEEKGYAEEDVAAILGENWFSLLRRTLPESS
ncbi:MAG TPA: membrane dipeptidase [Anaerolineales bacterium]|jgi:membrane dipeptidase|nr:membrane dipeptidase [Anaerolineales bacterium]